MNGQTGPDGIILIDKPAGMTSFSAVARIRKILHVKKVGHAGTLDPFATGLLTIAVGRATRVLRYMESYGKVYRATMILGVTTSTGDIDGEVTGGKKPSAEEAEALLSDDGAKIRNVITSFVGEIEQTPSIYSAIKINGRPAYDYARKGEQIEMKSRRVTIYSIDVKRIWKEEETIRVDMVVACSKGTYIRSLCEDIGATLGFGAHCGALRREMSGEYRVSEAYTLEQVEEMAEKGDDSFFLSENTVFTSFPKIEVTDKEAKDMTNGRKLDFAAFKDRMENVGDPENGDRFLACAGERLIAVVYVEEKDGQMLVREERVLEDVR